MCTSSSMSGVLHPNGPSTIGIGGGSNNALAYMLSGNVQGPSTAGATPNDPLAHTLAGGCEIHMESSFPHLVPPGVPNMGIAPAGGAVPLHYGHRYENKYPWGLRWLRPVMLCCTAHSLLSKFPSRAKRIDVISRVVFPMVFAVFNLAYWLYYLFAKSKSPQMNG